MVKKKKIRLKLTDFINTKYEKDVIYFLGFILKGTVDLKLRFWYPKNSINSEELKMFNMIYKIFIDKYDVQIYEMGGYHEFVWYDIMSAEDELKYKDQKFTSTYNNIDGLISCLAEFNSFYQRQLTFNSKNIKNKGKYENPRDRNKTMGKQNKN